jgi:hypothetical protein
MELSSIVHIDPSQLSDFKAEVFITTLGYETRCTHIARLLEHVSCRKVALESSHCLKEFSYEANREYLLSKEFEILKVESDVPDLEGILGTLMGENIGVLIDCTSMPPIWYYQFFKWFDEKQDFRRMVRMRIIYTMANFVNLENTLKVKEITNFLQADIKTSVKKKRALVLGLGQESNISESIVKMVEPDLLYLYYADPPVEKKFAELTFINNHALINATPIKNLISYPIRNGQAIYQSLINTILPLRNEHSIILIPHGPKIFSVVAMLIHLGYPDIRISYPSFKKPPAADRSPSGKPVVLDILFEGEE